MNEELHFAQTQVTEVQNELHFARTQMTEMQNENVQIRQWQQQMMAWQEHMNRQMMALQQSSPSTHPYQQPGPLTQSEPRNQFYDNEEQNDDFNDDDYNYDDCN